jgi:hypothetical protein
MHGVECGVAREEARCWGTAFKRGIAVGVNRMLREAMNSYLECAYAVCEVRTKGAIL